MSFLCARNIVVLSPPWVLALALARPHPTTSITDGRTWAGAFRRQQRISPSPTIFFSHGDRAVSTHLAQVPLDELGLGQLLLAALLDTAELSNLSEECGEGGEAFREGASDSDGTEGVCA